MAEPHNEAREIARWPTAYGQAAWFMGEFDASPAPAYHVAQFDIRIAFEVR
jgi:hypothetical protein